MTAAPLPGQVVMAGEVRALLLSYPDLICVEIAWSTGLILGTRRRD
jgi:hypothetical protein